MTKLFLETDPRVRWRKKIIKHIRQNKTDFNLSIDLDPDDPRKSLLAFLAACRECQYELPADRALTINYDLQKLSITDFKSVLLQASYLRLQTLNFDQMDKLSGAYRDAYDEEIRHRDAALSLKA